MFLEEKEKMIEQKLESLEINPIEDFSCLSDGECHCRILISELYRTISKLQAKIDTVANQQSYSFAYLASLGCPIDEQSLKDYQDCSCGNHCNS